MPYLESDVVLRPRLQLFVDFPLFQTKDRTSHNKNHYRFLDSVCCCNSFNSIASTRLEGELTEKPRATFGVCAALARVFLYLSRLVSSPRSAEPSRLVDVVCSGKDCKVERASEVCRSCQGKGFLASRDPCRIKLDPLIQSSLRLRPLFFPTFILYTCMTAHR